MTQRVEQRMYIVDVKDLPLTGIPLLNAALIGIYWLSPFDWKKHHGASFANEQDAKRLANELRIRGKSHPDMATLTRVRHGRH